MFQKFNKGRTNKQNVIYVKVSRTDTVVMQLLVSLFHDLRTNQFLALK